jgi:hypothetical protein
MPASSEPQRRATVKARLIAWLGGVTAAQHRQFVEALLRVIERAEVAVVLRDGTTLRLAQTAKPVIIVGNRIIVEGVTLTHGARVLVGPLSREVLISGVVSTGSPA